MAIKREREFMSDQIKPNDPTSPPARGSADARCGAWGCHDARLVWLITGESRQTKNGLLSVKITGWYCPVCAAGYGNFSPPNDELRQRRENSP